MEYTNTKTVYRIRNTGEFKDYLGNNSIGIFEFLTEKNAKRYIREQKLKNVAIDEVTITTNESIKML